MGLLTKEQIRELIKERNMKTTEDISLMFKDLFGETLKEMIEAEMDRLWGMVKIKHLASRLRTAGTGIARKR